MEYPQDFFKSILDSVVGTGWNWERKRERERERVRERERAILLSREHACLKSSRASQLPLLWVFLVFFGPGIYCTIDMESFILANKICGSGHTLMYFFSN
jgi:hypothetical protein